MNEARCEWFGTLVEARRRRSELGQRLRNRGVPWRVRLDIWRVWLLPHSTDDLIVACLNGLAVDREELVTDQWVGPFD